MSRLRLFAWLMRAVPALTLAGPCYAQGNIDAGRSPAQIFADACAVCHRDARELRRASTAYLRQHYTSGSEQAAIMAAYLARLPPPEPRAAQSKRAPATAVENSAAQQQTTADQAKSTQLPKGRRAGPTSEARALPQPAVDENSSPRVPLGEPQTSAPATQSPSPAVQPQAKPAPAALVPFQE